MSGAIKREDLVAEVLKDRADELLVVCGLGSSTYDVAGVEDHPRNFYLWGAMGQSLSVGLGIAIAQPQKRVLVVTGDGEMLMGLGSFSTASSVSARNLSVLVLDNGHYSETGGQPTHTSGRTSLAGVARECGFVQVKEIISAGEFSAAKDALLITDGPSLVVAKVAIKKYGAIVEPQTRKGHYISSRFRMAATGNSELGLD
tara:strand:+ start:3057 stop:3659 length:603 start_codon:yes stop_codon:yes gene_type:complete